MLELFFVLAPEAECVFGGLHFGSVLPEYPGVAGDDFPVDALEEATHGEAMILAADLYYEYDIEQKVAEFLFEIVPILCRDCLLGFFDFAGEAGEYCLKSLRAVPGAAGGAA